MKIFVYSLCVTEVLIIVEGIYKAFVLIGFILLWFYFRKKEYNPGILTMIYLIMYAVIRVFVSTFRVEDLIVPGIGIRAPYLISIIMVIMAALGIKYFSKIKSDK